MKPTIGRIVHYTAQHDPISTRALAAIVTAISESGAPYLTVFLPGGGVISVEAAPFSEEPQVGHWSWPPRA